MRLLIVEDDPAIAIVLRQALTEEGYGVDHAVTAQEGEALTQLFPYDVLILDVMLPEGTDAELRRWWWTITWRIAWWTPLSRARPGPHWRS